LYKPNIGRVTEISGAVLPPDVSHPFSPAGRADPYPAYQWLRENSPVHYDRLSRLWFVTAHADCAAVLADRRFSASLGQRQRTRDDELPVSMLNSDPPDHGRLRGPGALLLGPAALRVAAPDFEAAAHRLADGLAGQDVADPTADIGEPFAVEVFARILALPPERRATFTDLARRISVNLDPLAGPAAGRAGTAAAGEFAEFARQHVEALEAAGVSCPLTRLAADRRLTRSEMLGIVSLAVVGGFLPLADLAGQAAYWLTTQGRSFECFAQPAAEMNSQAIDELVRLATPIPFTARVATQPVELHGVLVPAGARALVITAAANRDPAVFADPNSFDPLRSPNPHLAFGAGPHVCLGAPLVRLAGGVLLGELARRFPGLRQLGTAEWDTPLVPRRLRGQRLLLRP
jgi:pimeloyl-[acyl-carrier protein] synthase